MSSNPLTLTENEKLSSIMNVPHKTNRLDFTLKVSFLADP